MGAEANEDIVFAFLLDWLLLLLFMLLMPLVELLFTTFAAALFCRKTGTSPLTVTERNNGAKNEQV